MSFRSDLSTTWALAVAALIAATGLAAADATPPNARNLAGEEHAKLRAAKDEARAADKRGDHAAAAAASRSTPNRRSTPSTGFVECAAAYAI